MHWAHLGTELGGKLFKPTDSAVRLQTVGIVLVCFGCVAVDSFERAQKEDLESQKVDTDVVGDNVLLLLEITCCSAKYCI